MEVMEASPLSLSSIIDVRSNMEGACHSRVGGGGSQYSGGQNSPWSELRNKRAVNIHGVGVSQQSGGITVKVMEASPLSLSSTMNVLSQQSGGVS